MGRDTNVVQPEGRRDDDNDELRALINNRIIFWRAN
jgi:hypothetical protein